MADTRGYNCEICRHWRRVGPRSQIGRCENRKSGQAFTRGTLSCAVFEIGLVAEAPERAEHAQAAL